MMVRHIRIALVGIALVFAVGPVGGAKESGSVGVGAWEMLGQPGTVAALGIRNLLLVSDTDIWVALRTEGVKHSIDGGRTWTKVGDFGNAAVEKIIDTPVGILVTATSGVYRLVDDRWQQSSIATINNNGSIPTVLPNGDILIYGSAPGGSRRAFVSSTGNTFAPISGTIHAGLGQTMFQDSQHRLWVGTEADGQYMSDDYGRTWRKIGPRVNGPAYGENTQGEIFYAEQAALYRWTGGTSATAADWPKSNFGLTDSDTVRTTLIYGTNIYLGTGTQNGNAPRPVYESTDDGRSWHPFRKDGSEPTQARVMDMKVDSQGYLLLALRDGTLWKSTAPLPPD
jgi:hypothetical protein